MRGLGKPLGRAGEELAPRHVLARRVLVLHWEYSPGRPGLRPGLRLLVGGFSWENCGDGKDPVVLQSLSVAPDPITIPGNLRISAAVTGTKGLTSPLKGSYSLPPSDFLLPDVELPSWMTNGNYRVRVAVSSKGEELACVKLAFSLQAP
ncbi:PREDICTED: ganglioside GM2 activator [Tinamus guttatus]|uniref:ganglioside GM2 activator n=1 Tax=Tinamus guttatus TaxID=94827 RepID=UPI00052F1219|nr:PREDICTED: ganglioside GM2 activator [Tinamus guttatus]